MERVSQHPSLRHLHISFFTVLNSCTSSFSTSSNPTHIVALLSCTFSCLLNIHSPFCLFCLFFSLFVFIFLGWFFLFSTSGRTRQQHSYPWEAVAHLAVTNRLLKGWLQTMIRWRTIYILTADLRGSSKLFSSYGYCWRFVETESESHC